MKLEIKDDANFEKAMAAYWKMRGYSDLEKVRAALEAYVPNIERTIAEAVAAERERLSKYLTPDIIRGIESAFESYEAAQDTSQEENDIMATKYTVLEAINAIRSAAK